MVNENALQKKNIVSKYENSTQRELTIIYEQVLKIIDQTDLTLHNMVLYYFVEGSLKIE